MLEMTLAWVVIVAVLACVWLVRDRLRIEKVIRCEYDERAKELMKYYQKHETQMFARVMHPDYVKLQDIEQRKQKNKDRTAIELKKLDREDAGVPYVPPTPEEHIVGMM